MADRWTENTARDMVKRTGGSVGAKQVKHTLPGIKVLGAIDYLVKVHKYARVRED